MIKFFRKTRYNLMGTGKTGKYLKYAIGEILLVMVGILLALQVNNWNEERKRESLKSSYIQSLKSDLLADIIILNTGIERLETDLLKNKSFSTRLSSPKATIDTLIKIARFEFNPRTGVPNDLNTNTYNALISTGNIDLLGNELTKKMQEHNAVQLATLKNFEINFQNYLDIANIYASKYPFNFSFNGINGPLMDSFWEDIGYNILKSDFNGILTSRIFTLSMVTQVRKKLVKQTQELIDFIDSSNLKPY